MPVAPVLTSLTGSSSEDARGEDFFEDGLLSMARKSLKQSSGWCWSPMASRPMDGANCSTTAAFKVRVPPNGNASWAAWKREDCVAPTSSSSSPMAAQASKPPCQWCFQRYPTSSAGRTKCAMSPVT